jgi:hypothetical protein
VLRNLRFSFGKYYLSLDIWRPLHLLEGVIEVKSVVELLITPIMTNVLVRLV